MKRMLLCFPAQAALGRSLASPLQADCGEVGWRHFPDGESLVRIDADVAGADVAILASLDRPDALALPLRFAAETCHELGASSVGLLAPYLGYMRQDQRFHPGEALSAPLFARFLEDSFDWLATVDPHLHRIPSLAGLFSIPVAHIDAAPAIAAWLRANAPDAVLIGPDAESRQWVEKIAQLAGLPAQVLQKVRRGDREVDVGLPDAEAARGRRPVLVDDIVSTGRTMAATLAQLHALGLPGGICIATHAVFAGDAQEQLLAAGAERVLSTDTIAHASNAIGIGELLVAPVAELFDAMVARADAEPSGPAEAWFDDQRSLD